MCLLVHQSNEPCIEVVSIPTQMITMSSLQLPDHFRQEI
uniref:Uncharacterized protein n=1 Tax=Arundo donax TaxID=35708 RepID=A0A0A9CMF1_ARUDO